VVATNAAESSITLPDVDVVICLGTHKALRYDQASHKVQLVNTWISKASSTQRAGRTGRVRPGKVFRLYSKHLFAGMQDHEESEIHRTPLQDVILGLRSMLEASVGFTGVVPILKDLLEPPDMRNVHKSFDYLHYAGMITVPDDIGALTSKGRLAGNLPVDLQLGCLIAYGVALGTFDHVNVPLGCDAPSFDLCESSYICFDIDLSHSTSSSLPSSLPHTPHAHSLSHIHPTHSTSPTHLHPQASAWRPPLWQLPSLSPRVPSASHRP
jgi:Helicase conserved C-terminal domain